MSLDLPLEGLLRPPLEWYTSATACVASSLLLTQPNIFLLPSFITKSAAAFLLGMVGLRFKQGYRIYRYCRQLKRMPSYTMSSRELPVSQKRLFLGRGFLWTPLHSQRLRDLDLDYNLSYRYPSKCYQKARERVFHWENKFFLKKIIPLLEWDSWLNPLRPYPDIGGEPCLHGVSEEESDVSISLADRAGHVGVIGTTGAGKTRFAEILIGQDIRRGDVVIVLDPKGDADLLKRMYIEAKAAGREHDLIIFHLGFPEHSARYNPIGYFTKITQVATRVTNGLPSSGNAAAFKDFAWKFVNLVTRALVSLGVKPTYKLLNFYITRLDQLFVRYAETVFAKEDNEFENWVATYIAEKSKINKQGELIQQPTRLQVLLAYGQQKIEKRNQSSLQDVTNDLLSDLLSACRLDKTYYDKITASVGPLLEKLTSDEIAELLSPDYQNLVDERPLFDWLQVIRQKKIVYIGMDAMTDTVVSSAVGNAMLSDLVSVAGHLYKFGLYHGFENYPCIQVKNPRINLHSDEFNEVIGDEFIPILNKARGAGFNVVAYTQTWSDVEARLGSTAKAGQVAGNLNSLIMFRTKEAKTVEMFLAQLPKVPILRVTPASSSSDSPHGEEGIYYQSTNEDRFAHSEVRLIEQSDVINLPKGQAWALLQGGKPYKLRMPLPKPEKDDDFPPLLASLVLKMRQRQLQQRG